MRDAVLAAAREELHERGWNDFSHRATARRAGVDPATVYRRWPTRPRLAADALLDLARNAVPVPDTGSVDEDLELFLRSVYTVLGDARLLQLFHALSVAASSDDDELRETVRAFWILRFEQASTMIGRGVERGELLDEVDPHQIIERLVAPLYFRALVSGEPLDGSLIRPAIEFVLAQLRP